MGNAEKKEVTRLLKTGLNHYGLGDLDAAIGCWEQARALDPENQAVHDYLETAYEERGPRPGLSVDTDKDDDPTPVSVDVSRPIGPGADDPTPGVVPPSVPFDPDEGDPDTLIAAALAAYKSGDLERAWQELEAVAEAQPERLDVKGYLQLLRNDRAQQAAREIGDQGRVLRQKCTTQEVMNLKLHPDEGFLLSQIDGQLSIQELISLATNDRVRALEIIARFLREGIVE